MSTSPRRARSPLLAAALAAGLSVTARAHAEDAASAGALFDRGVAEMNAGHFDKACPAIHESQRLDPRPGTLFTLAECEAKWGKSASAVAHYDEYVGLVSRLPSDQQARHHDRAELARAASARLKPTLPTLTIVLAADSAAGTEVRRDGIALQGASLGVPLPVDPGEHVIVAQAPGKAPVETRVTLVASQTQSLTVGAPAPAPTPAIAGAATAEPAKQPAPTNEPAGPSDKSASSGSTQRTWGFIAGGIGAAGIVTGSVLGVIVLGKKGTVDDGCTGAKCETEAAADAGNDGKKLGNYATVAFGVGIAGLATGAVLLLTAPHSASQGAAARPRLEPLFAHDRGSTWAGVRASF